MYACFGSFPDTVLMRGTAAGLRVLAALLLVASLVACQDAPFVPPWTPPEPPPPAEPEPPTQPLIAFVSNRDGNPEIYTMREDGTAVRRLTDHPADDYAPAWSPDRRWIAFVSDREGDEQIYVMRFDGSGVRRLTTGTGPNHSPTWSPDGQQIAFVSDRDGNEEIYVINPDGSSVTRLTHDTGRDFDPAWSPDGAKIAFASERESSASGLLALSELFVMQHDGSAVTRLTTAEQSARSPAWSPDGSRIAYVMWTSAGDVATVRLPQVFVINADGTGRTQLTTGDPTRYRSAAQPGWSADGSQIVFTGAEQGEEAHIFAMRPDGTEISRLSAHPAASANGGAVWSPDGTRIAFVSDRTGIAEIFTMAADGSTQARVPNTENAVSPLWSPDGTRLAFTSTRGGRTDVYTVSLDGGGLRKITDHPAADRLVCWLGSGERLAFLREMDGTWTLFAVNSDGSDPIALTSGRFEFWNYLVSPSPDCSPDGRRIIYVRRDSLASRSHLHAVNTDGSGGQQLSSRDADHGYPRWSPDGTRILYDYRVHSIVPQLGIMNSDGSEVKTIIMHAYGHAPLQGAWAPNGLAIAVRYPRRTGLGLAADITLGVFDLDGARIGEISWAPVYGSLPTWSPDGRWLAFTRSSTESEHPYSQRGEIYLSAPDGRLQRRLTHGTPFSAEAAWSR